MLAETCRNAGRLDRMSQLLKAYLRLGPDRPEAAAALALTEAYGQALRLSVRLLDSGTLTPEEVSFLGNPWMNIWDSRFLKRALRQVLKEQAIGKAARLRALHLFLLSSSAGRPLGRPPLFRGPLSVINAHSGRALLEAGREKEAARLLKEAVKNFPRDEYCCGELGEALLCCGLSAQALRLMQTKAAALRSPGFSAWQGQLLLTCARYAEAAAVLARKPAAASPMSLCWLGAASLRLGKTAAALALLQKAAAADPADAEARLWLAEGERAAGRNTAALSAAQDALALKPAHPWALLTVAFLTLRAGRAAAARRLYARFAAGPGRALNPPPALEPAWTQAALDRSSCRRQELHFLRLAGRRLVSAAD
jgi:tetratricopeptide (TPR) repeat protein